MKGGRQGKSSQTPKTNLAPLLSVKWILRYLLYMTMNLSKKTKTKHKLNAIYQNSANLLFTKMISPAMCVWEKKLLHSGTLMKYFEDLTQDIFPTFQDSPPKVIEWTENEYMWKQI